MRDLAVASFVEQAIVKLKVEQAKAIFTSNLYTSNVTAEKSTT